MEHRQAAVTLPVVGAVYCVYDDDRWLTLSLRSVYSACAKILVLISHQAWNGEAGDSGSTIQAIEGFPDPLRKIEIIRGDWADETTQRNAGLRLLADRNIPYCLVVDADEIWDEGHLRNLLYCAGTKPEVDAWRIGMVTYWKSHLFKIEPMEPYKPVALLKVGGAGFSGRREVSHGLQALVHPRAALMHHFSYARNDLEIQRKIARFSHSAEVAPDWFTRVWKGWERDRSLRYLNPAYPSAYDHSVPQPLAALPAVVRDAIQRGEIAAQAKSSSGARQANRYQVDLSVPPQPQSAAINARHRPGEEVEVWLNGTPFSFRCRAHSTDLSVVFDTFVGGYHLPQAPLPDSPTIVDVGANIGCTLVHYAALFPRATLVGVELDAENCRMAEQNTAVIGARCRVIHAAIWPEDTTVAYGGAEAWGYRIVPGGSTEVQALSMPTLLHRIGFTHVDFLKVDIEGAERELFSSDLRWLEKVQSLHVEVHDDEQLIQRLIEVLSAAGFNAARDTRHWSAVTASRRRA